MPDRPPQTRTLAFALAVWAVASAVAVAANALGARVALAVGVAGGVAFGVAAARRVGARRVKIRRRHPAAAADAEARPGAAP